MREHFDVNFSSAIGTAYVGSALGMITLPILVDFLITQYGWRSAFILLGALCLNICAFSLLFRPVQSVKQHELEQLSEDDNEDDDIGKPHVDTYLSKLFKSYGLLIKMPLANIYFFAFLLWGIAYTGWLLFLVSYALSLGYSSSSASFLSTCGGVGTLFGRCITPFTDLYSMSGQTLSFILSLGGTVSLFIYPWVSDYWILTLVSILAGFFLGTQPPVQAIFTREICCSNPHDFADALGLHYVFIGFGNSVGGPLTGIVFVLLTNIITLMLKVPLSIHSLISTTFFQENVMHHW